MQVEAISDSGAYGRAGVFRGHLRFSHPLLAEEVWPLCEIRGHRPGPRLCVSAGVHVNEVSSIEAAVRLQRLFDPDRMRGSVSIVPLVNQPARYLYSEYVCPKDGRNLNFTFPGDRDGTYSQALCHAIMSEWCAGADCYIDLHGGDLREAVSHFIMYQRTPDAGLEARARELARCFDADIVMGLPPEDMERPGRPPTGFARFGRLALMSEAGANGRLDEDDIAFHVDGVLNVAQALGIQDRTGFTFRRARVPCHRYLWVAMPVDGEFHAAVKPAERVEKGQRLGEVRDLFGRVLAEIAAPESGLLLWHFTHPTLRRGDPALAVAVEAS